MRALALVGALAAALTGCARDYAWESRLALAWPASTEDRWVWTADGVLWSTAGAGVRIDGRDFRHVDLCPGRGFPEDLAAEGAELWALCVRGGEAPRAVRWRGEEGLEVVLPDDAVTGWVETEAGVGVVGASGLWRLVDGAWTRFAERPSGWTLGTRVAGPDFDDLYAALPSGGLVHYDGAAWGEVVGGSGAPVVHHPGDGFYSGLWRLEGGAASGPAGAWEVEPGPMLYTPNHEALLLTAYPYDFERITVGSENWRFLWQLRPGDPTPRFLGSAPAPDIYEPFPGAVLPVYALTPSRVLAVLHEEAAGRWHIMEGRR